MDIREIPLKQLSENISYVAQDNFLFNCSLPENIRMGNPTASDEDVMSAQCGEFISRLEQGWDTPAGGKLSGGERQRIAIARAILKYAPVVILDEVTAFTDPENEAQLQCSIARLRALHLPLVFPGTEGSRSLIRIAPFDGARYRNPAVGFHRRIFVRARAASACEPTAHRIPGRRNPGYPRG